MSAMTGCRFTGYFRWSRVEGSTGQEVLSPQLASAGVYEKGVEVPNRFKERREDLRMTAEQAASVIGVTVWTLYSWERGDTKPNAEPLKRMAIAYNVSAD